MSTTKSIIAKNLRYYLELKGLTQLELGAAVGASPATVTGWIQGKSAPRADTLDRICEFLGIDKVNLVFEADSPNVTPAVSIPIYNSMYAEKNFFSDSNIKRYMSIDPSMEADFGIEVSSPSMEGAGINIGDIALFTKNFNFIEGRIYAVWILDRESIALKKVYHREGKFILVSEHSDFFPIVVGHNEALIVGELNGLYKKWNHEEV